MTEEELKELQALEARNLKIFIEPGNKDLADILRLEFLRGKKVDMDLNVEDLKKEKKKSFKNGKKKGIEQGFREGYEIGGSGFKEGYKKGLAVSEEWKLMKHTRIEHFINLIKEFPETSVIAIKHILRHPDSEAKKHIIEFIREILE